MKKKNLFVKCAEHTAKWTGTARAFLIAVAVVIIWGFTGPIFHFSDTWQLVINTGTTIITFLMVFLIQNTQNRDTKALQLKLDELIRVTEGAHTALLDLEELSEKELEDICEKYEEIARESRKLMRKGIPDTHIPNIDLNSGKEPSKKIKEEAEKLNPKDDTAGPE
jgi:low affinity Fe/Cu permease